MIPNGIIILNNLTKNILQPQKIHAIKSLFGVFRTA